MKTRSAFLLFIFGVLCLMGSGCASMGIKKRIAEKPEVFNALTPREQKVLQAGFIENNFNKDMVYIALGRPTETKSKDSPLGRVTTWVYKKYYANTAFVEIRPDKTSFRQYGQLTNSRGVATTQWNPSVDTDDAPMDTLYVVFIEDKVFGISLESQGGPVEL